MIQIQDLPYNFVIVTNVLQEIKGEVNKIGKEMKDINT